jgi:hypothetical protein
LAIAAPTGTESPVGEWWTESERRPAQAREQVIDDADVWLGEVDPEAYVVTPRLVAFGPGVQPRFRLLQSWEGRVVEVFDGGFVAHLCDLTTPGVEEQVEIEMEEISSDDAPLVVPGAVFYWGIGYLRSPSGSMTRASEIRFRRLPRWSKRDVGRIAERVAELKARTGIGG